MKFVNVPRFPVFTRVAFVESYQRLIQVQIYIVHPTVYFVIHRLPLSRSLTSAWHKICLSWGQIDALWSHSSKYFTHLSLIRVTQFSHHNTSQGHWAVFHWLFLTLLPCILALSNHCACAIVAKHGQTVTYIGSSSYFYFIGSSLLFFSLVYWPCLIVMLVLLSLNMARQLHRL